MAATSNELLLEREMDKFLSLLAKEERLTPSLIQATLAASIFGKIKTKVASKVLIRLAATYRSKYRLGRFRAALVVGTVLLGEGFVSNAEQNQLLLCDGMSQEAFGDFLRRLSLELQPSECMSLKVLSGRLRTYCVYHRMYWITESRRAALEAILRKHPRAVIRSVMALTHLYFLNHYLDFPIPDPLQTFLEKLGNPEAVGEFCSLIIATANKRAPLDSFDFASPINDIFSPDVQQLLVLAKGIHVLRETAQRISLFGYVLEEFGARPIFYMRPPSLDFEYSVMLGDIRQQMGKLMLPMRMGNLDDFPKVSMITATRALAKSMKPQLGEIVDAESEIRRIRLRFPLIPGFYNFLHNRGFYEDLAYLKGLQHEFLMPMRETGSTEVRLTEHMSLETFHDIWRVFQFLGLLDVELLRLFYEQDNHAVHNSLVRVLKENDISQILAQVGFSNEQSEEFFRLAAADTSNLGYYDIQYRPFLRIAPNAVQISKEVVTTKPEMIYLPGLVYLSNVFRNVQASNQIRLEANARLLVDAVAAALSKKCANVRSNRPIKLGEHRTDIDIVILEKSTLYIIECKYSVPPTGPHELRDLWQDIEKGASQLAFATSVLSDQERRQSYIAGWFPGIRRFSTEHLRIQPVILCSHLMFSGLVYMDIPIRDFASLNFILSDGSVSMNAIDTDGEMITCKHRVWKDANFSIEDFDDYLSARSRYFQIFKNFMRPISRIDFLSEGNCSMARETYVYSVDENWVSSLDALGFERLPDEKRTLKRPWSDEEFESLVRERDAPS